MNAAERAELNRQGAKAAARGDTARTNPLRQRRNRPRFTGEKPSSWVQRLRAWSHGFERERCARVCASEQTHPAVRATLGMYTKGVAAMARTHRRTTDERMYQAAQDTFTAEGGRPPPTSDDIEHRAKELLTSVREPARPPGSGAAVPPTPQDTPPVHK